MSVTNLQIITDALREINVINETQVATAAQSSKALRRLNQLMEKWKEEELDLGWVKATSTADDAAIPDYAELAVTLALAVSVAPSFSTEPSRTLIALTQDAVNSLKSKHIREKLDNVDMTHMPEGSGRWGNRYDINTDVT